MSAPLVLEAGFQAPSLTQRRFGGLERLYGVSGAARIRASHVVVVGVGGVGSWTVEALARSGVGRLTLIDLDHVSESNINRQIHALDNTLGMAKVEAMRQRIAHINPDCVVTCIEDFVEPNNWPRILNGADVDAVIDACDQIKAKTAMAAWAIQQRVVFISVGAAGGKRQAHKVDVDDLCHTSHDPLLAKLRYNLRREHGAAREGKIIGVACVFSREAVAPPDASCDMTNNEQGDGSLNCSGYGSVVSVTATFGQCAAGWVIDQISSSPLPKL
ncbi:tRNA threonylcarbamoyladenosine dehydratase [Limnohabitans sp.]|uniref:tRNA threonylcarbamoyladenosine dehydratase n=1 Tax=Limnohabitans sp. TaxID=1907725 RepID=UPI00334282C4